MNPKLHIERQNSMENQTSATTTKTELQCRECEKDAQIHDSIIYGGKLYHTGCLVDKMAPATAAQALEMQKVRAIPIYIWQDVDRNQALEVLKHMPRYRVVGSLNEATAVLSQASSQDELPKAQEFNLDVLHTSSNRSKELRRVLRDFATRHSAPQCNESKQDSDATSEQAPVASNAAATPASPVLASSNEKQIKIEFSAETLLQITKLLPKDQTLDRIRIAHALSDYDKVLGRCKQCKGAFLADDMLSVEECKSNASIRELMLLIEPKTPEQTRNQRFKNRKSEPVPVLLFCSAECDKAFNNETRECIKIMRDAVAAEAKKPKRETWRNAPSAPAAPGAKMSSLGASSTTQRYTRTTLTTLTRETPNAQESATVKTTEVYEKKESEIMRSHAAQIQRVKDAGVSEEARKLYDDNLEFEIAHKTYRMSEMPQVLEHLKPKTVINIKLQHPNSSFTYRTFGAWKEDQDFSSLDAIVLAVIRSTGNFSPRP